MLYWLIKTLIIHWRSIQNISLESQAENEGNCWLRTTLLLYCSCCIYCLKWNEPMGRLKNSCVCLQVRALWLYQHTRHVDRRGWPGKYHKGEQRAQRTARRGSGTSTYEPSRSQRHCKSTPGLCCEGWQALPARHWPPPTEKETNSGYCLTPTQRWLQCGVE